MAQPLVPGRCLAALNVLLQAHDYAFQNGIDPWQFAVEVGELRSTGLSDAELRWLLGRGYVQQAVEESEPGNPERSFRQTATLALFSRSCFVLTSSGVALAR